MCKLQRYIVDGLFLVSLHLNTVFKEWKPLEINGNHGEIPMNMKAI